MENINFKTNESNSFVGDILIIKSNCWQGRLIRPWTGEWNHTAMRTKRNTASSMSNNGKEYYNLLNMPKEYTEWIILRYNNLDDDERKELKKLDRKLSVEYDYKSLFILSSRQMLGIKRNLEDISTENKFTCTSRIGFMYNQIGKDIRGDIHFSQLYPIDFFNGKSMEVICQS